MKEMIFGLTPLLQQLKALGTHVLQPVSSSMCLGFPAFGLHFQGYFGLGPSRQNGLNQSLRHVSPTVFPWLDATAGTPEPSTVCGPNNKRTEARKHLQQLTVLSTVEILQKLGKNNPTSTYTKAQRVFVTLAPGCFLCC